MVEMAATEATSPEQLVAWHDQALAEYEAALAAYQADQSDENRAVFHESRDSLQTGVTYWRQVGEQVGTRTGVEVVDNTIEAGPAEEGDVQ